ncbi:alpha/beta hydrolase [Microlunatus endophyticus]
MHTTRIPYGDHPSQWIDLSTPESATAPLPVVIFIHGGYWRQLHGADQGEPLIKDLVANGVAAVNVEYRRVGKSPVSGGGGWPATFLDIAAAIDSSPDATNLILVGWSRSATQPAANWRSGLRRVPGYRPARPARIPWCGCPATSVSAAYWI